MILVRFAIGMLAVTLLACAISYSQADQNGRAAPVAIETAGD